MRHFLVAGNCKSPARAAPTGHRWIVVVAVLTSTIAAAICIWVEEFGVKKVEQEIGVIGKTQFDWSEQEVVRIDREVRVNVVVPTVLQVIVSLVSQICLVAAITTRRSWLEWLVLAVCQLAIVVSVSRVLPHLLVLAD
jgi:hypothetical protein